MLATMPGATEAARPPRYRKPHTETEYTPIVYYNKLRTAAISVDSGVVTVDFRFLPITPPITFISAHSCSGLSILIV